MRLVKFLLALFSISLFTACYNNSEFEGYTKTDTGLHYKLQEIGDGSKKPKIGDYLQLIITYKTSKDSVFYDTYFCNETGKVILPFNHSSYEGSFEEGLRTMNEGDRVSFIVDGEALFKIFFKAELPYFIKKGEVIKMDVKLHKILNEEEYKKELVTYEQLLEDRDIEEQCKFLVYLDTIKTKFIPLDNGMYYQSIVQGTGAPVEEGKTVSIHYKGLFLNEKVFESTYDRGEAMSFIYGDEGQVIKGLEKAISIMNEGAKAKFIIPSQLAFGETGSSNGRVPPFTTVVYELEILKIN